MPLLSYYLLTVRLCRYEHAEMMGKGEKSCHMIFVVKMFLALVVSGIFKVVYITNLEGIECHSQRKAFLS